MAIEIIASFCDRSAKRGVGVVVATVDFAFNFRRLGSR